MQQISPAHYCQLSAFRLLMSRTDTWASMLVQTPSCVNDSDRAPDRCVHLDR